MKNSKPLYKRLWPWIVLVLLVILTMTYPALSQFFRLAGEDALVHNQKEEDFYEEQGYYPLKEKEAAEIPEEDFVTIDLPATVYPPAPYPEGAQQEYDQYVNSAPSNVKIPLPEKNYNRWDVVEAIVPEKVYLTEGGTQLLNMTDSGFVLELKKELTGSVNFSDAVVKKGDSCTVWVSRVPYKTIEEYTKSYYGHRSAWPEALNVKEREDLKTNEVSVWELSWEEEGYPEWKLLLQRPEQGGVYTMWYFLGDEQSCGLSEPISQGFHVWEHSLPKTEGDWHFQKPFTNEELEFEHLGDQTFTVYKKEGYKVNISDSPHVYFNEIESYQSPLHPEETPKIEKEAQMIVRTPNNCPYYITSKSKEFNGTLEDAVKNIEREFNEMPYGYDHVTPEVKKVEGTDLEAYFVDWIFHPEDFDIDKLQSLFVIAPEKTYYFQETWDDAIKCDELGEVFYQFDLI